MTYETALEKIHSLLTFGSRPGLDRMRTLLCRLGNPQDNLKYIHVAGTNGKGSVCAVISSVLVSAGYKTGLFISPYITDFRERIQINNEMISKHLLADAVEATFPIVEKLQSEGVIITEFEYVNALQFYIHSRENCDVVVLETGMGGLLDCTNVIKPPLCSVITSIGIDHSAVLGNTIEEITVQKCGIIKDNSVVVTSKQNKTVMEIIEKTASDLNVPLVTSNSVKLSLVSQSLYGSKFEYNNNIYKLNLAGEHQIENTATAIAAIQTLCSKGEITVTQKQLSKGIESAKNPARLEVLSSSPVVLLDGAHNPDGINALRNSLSTLVQNKKVIGILGMLADKDIDSSISLLGEVFDEVITVSVNNPRTLSSISLCEKCRVVFDNVLNIDSPFEAFDYAYKKAVETDSVLVICGSLYLAGELRPYILKK